MEFSVKRPKYILTILLTLLLSSIYAQDGYHEVEYEPASIDESSWQEVTEGREYYELSDKKPKKEKKNVSKKIKIPKQIRWPPKVPPGTSQVSNGFFFSKISE